MKKIIYTLMILVMVLGQFVGCSKEHTDKAEDVASTMTSDSGRTNGDHKRTAYDNEVDGSYGYEESEIAVEDWHDGGRDISGETYDTINETPFTTAERESVSTFSIDVDTASYTNIRDMIEYGLVPPKDAVRIEEMINYFDYEYPSPDQEDVFGLHTAVADNPWDDHSHLMMIGIQGYDLPDYALPDNNIVFLIDVSGSMQDDDKLPLLVEGFEMMVNNFDKNDRVSIVVYAGDSGVVLSGVRGHNHNKIIKALRSLEAGGSTAGSEGIELAYQLAEDYYIEDGNNRIILATDGDFNVGITDTDDLEDFIAEKRETGIYLSVAGFGAGNYNDAIAERLADKGNGNYAYIDSVREAERVFKKAFASNLYAIANDVKIQVDFNESLVYAYKLVGYENRVMDNEDFEDDRKDAGELGLGHTVTALYELILEEGVDAEDKELYATVSVRYKEPGDRDSQLLEYAVTGSDHIDSIGQDKNFLWAASVAEFGLLLRNEAYIDFNGAQDILERLDTYYGRVSDPYKAEFIQLVKAYKDLN